MPGTETNLGRNFKVSVSPCILPAENDVLPAGEQLLGSLFFFLRAGILAEFHRCADRLHRRDARRRAVDEEACGGCRKTDAGRRAGDP